MLRDIKPIVEIPDYSLYILIATVAVGLYFGYILFRKFYIYSRSKCSIDCEKYYYTQFCNIDWSKPKEASYLATKYGLVLAKDKRKKEIFNQLRDRLDIYKYRKDIDKIDSETLNYYNLFKQVCNESI